MRKRTRSAFAAAARFLAPTLPLGLGIGLTFPTRVVTPVAAIYGELQRGDGLDRSTSRAKDPSPDKIGPFFPGVCGHQDFGDLTEPGGCPEIAEQSTDDNSKVDTNRLRFEYDPNVDLPYTILVPKLTTHLPAGTGTLPDVATGDKPGWWLARSQAEGGGAGGPFVQIVTTESNPTPDQEIEWRVCKSLNPLYAAAVEWNALSRVVQDGYLALC